MIYKNIPYFASMGPNWQIPSSMSNPLALLVQHRKSLEVIIPTLTATTKTNTVCLSAIFLKPIRQLRSQNKLLPPKLEKQVNTKNYNLLEKKPMTWNLCGNQHRGRETWANWWNAGGSVWTTLRLRTSGRCSQGVPIHFYEFYLLEFYQVLTVNIR